MITWFCIPVDNVLLSAFWFGVDDIIWHHWLNEKVTIGGCYETML